MNEVELLEAIAEHAYFDTDEKSADFRASILRGQILAIRDLLKDNGYAEPKEPT